MNYKTIKRPEKRIHTQYNSSWKIQSYGDDNIYPNRMADLIANSPTGGTCCERYRTFIEGNGLNDEDLADYTCNRAGDTVDDVFRLIASDVAHYGGFALHVNYNLKGQITEMQHVPFVNCRLDEEDDRGRVPYISVHPDWEGRKTRNGRTINITLKTIRKFYPFNPIPEVVLSQMVKDGGIEHYRGQILWVSLSGRNVYPLPIYDKVATELSIDEGLSNVKYRNVRNNFLLSGMIVHRKGATIGIDDNGVEYPIDEEDDGFSDSLTSFQGDINACSIMDVGYTQEEDIPKFVAFEGANFDKKFEVTEQSTTERIYSAFGQEPWYSIRRCKVNFDGEMLRDAYEYYNSYVENERRTISRALKKVFKYWHKENGFKDFEIEPLVYQYNYANGNLDQTQQQNGNNGTSNLNRDTEEGGEADR